MLGLRILHIDTGAEMRGGQYQVMLLMKAQREAGHQCILLARRGSPLWLAGTGALMTVHAANARNVWKHSRWATIVHAHDARAHTLAAIASRQKFVVSRRVAFPIREAPFSRWKYRRSARYLAVSQFVAEQLKSATIPEDKIHIVFDAVERTNGSAVWNPENPAVALDSRDPQKGRELIEKAAKASGVEVRFSDNLVRDLQQASMFIYITQSEGLGSAALLAMEIGVPVIASRIGGLAEVFVDGLSGIYVNNEVADLVRAMRRILGARSLAQSLIEGGRMRVREHFGVDRLLQSTLDAYSEAFGA